VEGERILEETSKGIRILRVLKGFNYVIKQKVEHHFKDLNLTGPQGMLVGTLAHYGEMKISDLSDKLGLSNSTVSGIVDRLENQGLVERKRSKDDRRVVRVSVTTEFRRNAQGHFSEIERMFEDIMNKATPEETEVILKGLETLERLMASQREQN